MTRAQSTMIIRTVAGFILLAAGIGLNIILVGGALAEHGDYALIQFVVVEVPMIFNCWVLTAVGWWLMYPRQWVSFLTAAICFVVISGVWLAIFFGVFFGGNSAKTLWLVMLLILPIIAIFYGLWWFAHRDKGQGRNQVQRQTETAEQQKVNRFAIGAIVCGVCGMFLLHGGIVLSLLGITLGLLSSHQIGRDRAQSGSGLAIAGAMCGGIGSIIGTIIALRVFDILIL